MEHPLTVVKIGGNVVDNPDALERFADIFASLPGPKILVHGGGKEATRLSKRLDIPTQMIDGRRVTDIATLDVVTMVYAGLVNKRVVALLQARGVDAVGLSGADGGAVKATKRPAEPVDYGFVGDLTAKSINTKFVKTLIDNGNVPVFCAIMHDGNGTLLNCNADSVASAVACGMAQAMPTKLVYCFEKKGVLRDVDDPNSVIPEITPANYADLRSSGAVSQGMIPKIDNALAAVESGVVSVTIKHSDDLADPLAGTKISASAPNSLT